MSAVHGEGKEPARGPRVWLSYQFYRARWSYRHDPTMACYYLAATIGFLLVASYLILLLLAVIESYSHPIWSTTFELSSRLQFPVVKVCGIGRLTPPPTHVSCAFYPALGGLEQKTTACTPRTIPPNIATGSITQLSVGSCLAYNIDRTLWAASLETSLVVTVTPLQIGVIGVLADDRLQGVPGVTTYQITSSGVHQLFLIHPNERRFRGEQSRTYYTLSGGMGIDQKGLGANVTVYFRFASYRNEVSTETVEFSVLVMLAAIGGVVSLYRAFCICIRLILRVWYFKEPEDKDEAARIQNMNTLGRDHMFGRGHRHVGEVSPQTSSMPNLPNLDHHSRTWGIQPLSVIDETSSSSGETR